ncbi:hypothetical protein EJ02DRAFT_447142 [Clathrospora elynae]|uniref:Zn(2)-C6 fungal-type domain-containing protein n=1 Tax=Clathrospora elynae TaxID=706981 RepID=A0A6A5SHH4_9PLEO|nr:hypothetical protein EJ02DRAFT_447142 [Clathrospora elynae]
MPALLSHGVVALQARDWRDTVGQSGMTPTAFSFLIPVFVVAIAAPFLCIFCIRKRRQVVPVRPAPRAKKPALRRAEARERLNEVTEASNVTGVPDASRDGSNGDQTEIETQSVLERECAICLSTLHAPAPPEPAKLSDTPITDEAAKPPSITAVSPEFEAILKLQVCGHEFHAECLTSWFVLRKTSCPICRSVYFTKEAMQQYDAEEDAAVGGATPATVEAHVPPPRVANWRYFLHGHSLARRQGQPQFEMQNRAAGEEAAQQPARARFFRRRDIFHVKHQVTHNCSTTMDTKVADLPPVIEPEPTTAWTPANASAIRMERPAASATPPDTGEHTSPPAKRRREDRERTRVSRACDRCKKKKTRCTGTCPCKLCLTSGLPCEFTAPYTRGRLPSVRVDDSAMSSENSRAPLPENTSSQDAALPPFQYPRIYPGPSIDRSVFSTADNLNTPNDYATHARSSRNSPEPQGAQRDQQGHYVGSSSAVSFLIRIQKRLHQNSSLSHDSTIFTFGDAPLPEVDPPLFVLPKPDAQRLVERYFDYAAPTHRFLHRPSIESLVDEFYETQGEMRGREDVKAKAALLMVVFAQAQAYMPPGSTVQDNSSRYYFAAEHLLSKERGAVRLASVQARLLQCFYLLTQSRINHCWSLFGALSHLAFAIGLNRGRKCDPSSTVDYVELESRRRLFWCAYSLDKYLAAALGRPRTFKDEDIDQELPTVVNDNDLHPTYIIPTSPGSHSVMLAPVEHIKLTRIVSHVLRDLYSIRPPILALRIELSSRYTSDLHDWRNSLSRFLSDSGVDGGIDSHLLIPIYQRQRSVLNLAYHHALLLIHRPFLLRDFASLTHMPTHPNWGQNAGIDTSANVSACLEAAMAIVRVVDDVFTSSNLFRSFWFTQYYAFCAVVVLYIYRIQQHLVTPGKCEGYFAAGQKCQRQLESVSETDCLARRYCLVLEELRVEAARQTGKLSNTTASSLPPQTITPSASEATLQDASANLSLPTPTPQTDTTASPPGLTNAMYNNSNIPHTPDSASFNPSFLPDDNFMFDLASWPQFDSLVTGGIGMFDGAGFQGDNGFGFGNFNML